MMLPRVTGVADTCLLQCNTFLRQSPTSLVHRVFGSTRLFGGHIWKENPVFPAEGAGLLAYSDATTRHYVAAATRQLHFFDV